MILVSSYENLCNASPSLEEDSCTHTVKTVLWHAKCLNCFMTRVCSQPLKRSQLKVNTLHRLYLHTTQPLSTKQNIGKSADIQQETGDCINLRDPPESLLLSHGVTPCIWPARETCQLQFPGLQISYLSHVGPTTSPLLFSATDRLRVDLLLSWAVSKLAEPQRKRGTPLPL